MKKTGVIKTENTCEFCNQTFARERTIINHICQNKHRWMERDKKSNRIGYQAWLQFFSKTSMSKTNKVYEDFIRSPYYTAFIKFGAYCCDIKAVNITRYVDWLLKEKIKIDTWCKDSNYNKYLIEYTKTEDPFDAVARSIETMIDLANESGIKSCDYLRYGNSNKICYAITTGKITPWVLYQSESGIKFLSSVTADQEKMILDYINPEQWAIRFIRDKEDVVQIKSLLNDAGY
jgi:hypothetical protein